MTVIPGKYVRGTIIVNQMLPIHEGNDQNCFYFLSYRFLGSPPDFLEQNPEGLVPRYFIVNGLPQVILTCCEAENPCTEVCFATYNASNTEGDTGGILWKGSLSPPRAAALHVPNVL